MGQTAEGAIKARKTLLARYGGEEGYRAFMREIAAQGGKVSNPKKGFGGMSYEKRAAAGRKGGSRSPKAKETT